MRASLTDDPRRRLCGRDDQHLLDVPASEPVAVMDRRTHEGITTGTVTLPRRSVHVGVWFRLLRTLLDEVNTPTSQLRCQLSKQALRQIWQTAGRPTVLVRSDGCRTRNWTGRGSRRCWKPPP